MHNHPLRRSRIAIVEAAELLHLHDGDYGYSSLIYLPHMHASCSIPHGETRRQVGPCSPSSNRCLGYYLQGKDDVCSSRSESVSRQLSPSLNYERPTTELYHVLYRFISLGQPEFECMKKVIRLVQSVRTVRAEDEAAGIINVCFLQTSASQSASGVRVPLLLHYSRLSIVVPHYTAPFRLQLSIAAFVLLRCDMTRSVGY
jgi:hypothetical protein